MATSKFESLWQLMSLHSFEVDNETSEEDLTCNICHKLMVDACQSSCECQYCRECIRGYMVGGGDKYCPGNNVECKEEYLVLDKDVMRNKRMNSKISKLKVKCINEECQEKRELLEMTDHLRVCTKLSSKCPYIKVGCDNEGGSKDAIDCHLAGERFNHTRLLIEYIDTLTNELNELKLKVEKNQLWMESMEDQWRRKENEMMLFKKDILEERRKNEEERKKNEEERGKREEERNENRRLHDVEEVKSIKWIKLNKLLPKVDSDFLWRVNECSKKTSNISIYSESFYSNNYKFCLNFRGKGEDISLFSVIMKGYYDEEVRWPMRLMLTLSIVDQNTLRPHESHSFQYDTYGRRKTAFEKPKGDRNDCYIGTYSFIKYSSIKGNPSVVVDDSIVLSCVLRN